jgi:hypothetical protein
MACISGCFSTSAVSSAFAVSSASVIVGAPPVPTDERPCHAGRLLQRALQPVDQVARGVFGRLQLDPAGGVGHEPQAGFHLDQELHVAGVFDQRHDAVPCGIPREVRAGRALQRGLRARGGGAAGATGGAGARATGAAGAATGARDWPTGAEGGASVSFFTRSPGVGRSATWVRRITAISAAIIALGASRTSSSAFRSICHIRVSARIGRRSRQLLPPGAFARADGGVLGGVGRDLDHRQPMGDLRQIAQDRHGIGPVGVLPAKLGQRARRVAAHDRLEEVQDPAPVGKAQHRADLIGAGFARAMGDGLIEKAHRVADGAFGGAGDERQRLFRDLGAFLAATLEMRDHHLRLDPAQVEALASRLRTVTGTLRISVVAKRNFTWAGGSSSVFSSALNALVDSM